MLNIEACGIAGLRRGMSRRDFIKAGTLALTGLSMVDLARLLAQGQGEGGKARSVIQLWMNGGPPHLDTFDPKPAAGEDYCGPYRKPIETNVKGIQLCETMPMMARQADKFSILRGMTHSNNGHETAAYIMQTGTLSTGDLVYPTVGAVVAYKRQEQGPGASAGGLPPYMMLSSPLGRFSEAGFLGNRYTPFATGGDPNSKDFRVNGLVPPPGMTNERIGDRRGLLEEIDSLKSQMDKDGAMQQMDSFQQKAYGLILGEARKAFDLTQEKDEVRERYGRTTFGQSCLLARRLVENGVPFITINWGGWDTHKQHFERMAEMLPNLDKAFSALLEDLAQRGLLDSTIVVWTGEFGRTPKIAKEPPWMGGRHHFAQAFCAVVAGGGFKGGKVVGATDRTGEKVADRPIYPWDLSASIYKLMGIDPNGKLPHPQGRVVYVTPPASAEITKGGMLTEIM